LALDQNQFTDCSNINIEVNSQALSIGPTQQEQDIDQFDAWYVEQQGTTIDGFYKFEGQEYVKTNISVVTTQVENASIEGAHKVDVAYGMKAETSQVQVSRPGSHLPFKMLTAQ
jgi:hypothetical protein